MDRTLSASDFKGSCSLLCCPDCFEETPDHNIAPHVDFDWAATLRFDACDSRTEWHHVAFVKQLLLDVKIGASLKSTRNKNVML
jgi:hypothetical protein